MSFKPFGDAAAIAARHRRFIWCRRENDFSDMPVWRVVARSVKLPLAIIVAFANRLEELANKGEPRGCVSEFNGDEFSAALDISAEDAARVYAALEDPKIGWIHSDHVVSFYRRNPDREDATAAVRQQRVRDRKKGMKQIARDFALGRIDEAERARRELALLGLPPLSTETVTRDSVTVTPEQIKNLERANSGENGPQPTPDTTSSKELATDDPADATTWLQFHGKRLVVERLEVNTTLAGTRISRWLEQLEGNAVALVEIIRAADKTDYMGAPFHNLIVDQIRRSRSRNVTLQLPLAPTIIKREKAGGS